MALSKKVHRIVVLSIPTVHTLAHTGKQVNTECSTLVMTSTEHVSSVLHSNKSHRTHNNSSAVAITHVLVNYL